LQAAKTLNFGSKQASTFTCVLILDSKSDSSLLEWLFNMAEECRLPLQSEKALAYTIKPHLLAYCPRTDLLAVVTQDEVIEVYRIGGQRAFVIKRKSPSTTIVGLEWIRDGWFS
jgi:hypothetical protein